MVKENMIFECYTQLDLRRMKAANILRYSIRRNSVNLVSPKEVKYRRIRWAEICSLDWENIIYVQGLVRKRLFRTSPSLSQSANISLSSSDSTLESASKDDQNSSYTDVISGFDILPWIANTCNSCQIHVFRVDILSSVIHPSTQEGISFLLM
jgi:hypothetical protein